MASRFLPVTDEQMFVVKEAVVSPDTKKDTTFSLTVCIEVFFKAISNE